jgi:hypothetical protein
LPRARQQPRRPTESSPERSLQVRPVPSNGSVIHARPARSSPELRYGPAAQLSQRPTHAPTGRTASTLRPERTRSSRYPAVCSHAARHVRCASLRTTPSGQTSLAIPASADPHLASRHARSDRRCRRTVSRPRGCEARRPDLRRWSSAGTGVVQCFVIVTETDACMRVAPPTPLRCGLLAATRQLLSW